MRALPGTAAKLEVYSQIAVKGQLILASASLLIPRSLTRYS